MHSPLKYRPKPVWPVSSLHLLLLLLLLMLQLKPRLTSSTPKPLARSSISHSRVVIGCLFLLCTDMSQNLISSQMSSKIIYQAVQEGEELSVGEYISSGDKTPRKITECQLPHERVVTLSDPPRQLSRMYLNCNVGS